MVSYDLNHGHRLTKPVVFVSYDRKTGELLGGEKTYFPAQIEERVSYFQVAVNKINTLRILVDRIPNEQKTQAAKQHIGEHFPVVVHYNGKVQYRCSINPLSYSATPPETLPSSGTVLKKEAAVAFVSAWHHVTAHSAKTRLTEALNNNEIYPFARERVEYASYRSRFPVVYRVSDLIELF